MQYSSFDDIVYIHDAIIENTGGSLGIREPGLLHSIVEKPKSSFGGAELYPQVFDKAAVIYEALCNYRVFIDGSKRSAALAMYRFLSINGFQLTASNQELETFTEQIAVKKIGLNIIAEWIEKHCKGTTK